MDPGKDTELVEGHKLSRRIPAFAGMTEAEDGPLFCNTRFPDKRLKNKLRQIDVLRKIAQTLPHVSRVDNDGCAGLVGRVEADVLQKLFKQRMQPLPPSRFTL